MKINHQQKEIKNQRPSLQKNSYIPITNPNSNKQRVSENLADYQNIFGTKDTHYPSKRKDMEDIGFMNPFADDSESTRQFTKCQNYQSTQNLMTALNVMPTQIKNVRESENIHGFESNKTPTNSTGDKKMASIKSASNLLPHMNTQLSGREQQVKIQSKEQQCEQIQDLINKIKQAQKLNEKIKQQNIQLRLLKLSTNSQSMQMLSIKLQIQELKKKIEKIRNDEKKGGEQTYSQYYAGKKLRQINQEQFYNPNSNLYGYNMPQTSKQRVSETNQRQSSIERATPHLPISYSSQSPHINPSLHMKPRKNEDDIKPIKSQPIQQKKIYFSQRQIMGKGSKLNKN